MSTAMYNANMSIVQSGLGEMATEAGKSWRQEYEYIEAVKEEIKRILAQSGEKGADDFYTKGLTKWIGIEASKKFDDLVNNIRTDINTLYADLPNLKLMTVKRSDNKINQHFFNTMRSSVSESFKLYDYDDGWDNPVYKFGAIYNRTTADIVRIIY